MNWINFVVAIMLSGLFLYVVVDICYGYGPTPVKWIMLILCPVGIFIMSFRLSFNVATMVPPLGMLFGMALIYGRAMLIKESEEK